MVDNFRSQLCLYVVYHSNGNGGRQFDITNISVRHITVANNGRQLLTRIFFFSGRSQSWEPWWCIAKLKYILVSGLPQRRQPWSTTPQFLLRLYSGYNLRPSVLRYWILFAFWTSVKIRIAVKYHVTLYSACIVWSTTLEQNCVKLEELNVADYGQHNWNGVPLTGQVKNNKTFWVICIRICDRWKPSSGLLFCANHRARSNSFSRSHWLRFTS